MNTFKTMTNEDFREKRREMGLTKQALAVLFNVTLQTIYNIEGTKKISEVYRFALLGLEAELNQTETLD